MSSICSYKTDSEKHLVHMQPWFPARKYPSDLVQKEMSKVFRRLNENQTKKKSKGAPLVINFYPVLKGALSALRKFLATEIPLKIMKNAFYFMLKALFVLKIFKFLS